MLRLYLFFVYINSYAIVIQMLPKVYREFIKFCIIGVINTSIDFVIYYILTRTFTFWSIYKIAASTVAFLFANLNSYIFNKKWTFRNTTSEHHRLLIKFLIVSSSGLGLNIIVFSTVLHFGFHDLFAKLCAVGVVIFWNFILNKFWTFSQSTS